MIRDRTPLVSVVIPCYNYGKYVEETVDSVSRSTFQDFEIIVVDDGSTDPFTLEKLSTLRKPKMRIIRQSNQGLATARNRGIAEAQGKYVLPLDSDDLIHSTYLEKAFWILELYPEVGFVSPWVQAFGTENWSYPAPQFNFHTQLFHNITCGNSVFRKEAWVQAGGYKKDFIVMGYEDWDFWVTLGENGWYGYQVFERLFLYRRHGSTMVHAAMEHHDKLFEQIKAYHPELYQKPYLDKLRKKWDEEPLIDRIKPDLQGSDWNHYETRPVRQDRSRWLLLLPQIRRESISARHLEFIDGMHPDWYGTTMVSTGYGIESGMEDFKWLTDDIFELSLYIPEIELRLDLIEKILSKLIISREIERIIILGSRQADYLLPHIKYKFPHIVVDIRP
ncbi:MAG: glycosyltransferase family 2 protein [Gorillibacterium sp.]|nr:glycosyltransferase family 2 protein [Gorillibacterium sp.]